MAKTLVIFDIDGTLVYSNKIDSQCFAKTYEIIYDREFPTIDWTQFPHVTDTTIFKTVIRNHFNREIEAGEIEYFQQQFVSMLEDCRRTKPEDFREVPSARQTVELLLQDERFVVGIGTGGWLKPAKVKLRHVGIHTEGMIVAGADGHEQRESIIGEVVTAVSSIHEVSRTVYIGDAIWDVNTTRRLNMNFVGIRRTGDAEVLRQAGTGIVLQDYQDFGLFIEAIMAAEPPRAI